MNNNKIIIRLIRKERFNYVCEEKETGKEVTLKLSPKLPDQNPELNKEYWAIINQNWINSLEAVNSEEVKSTQNKTLNEISKCAMNNFVPKTSKDIIIIAQNQTKPAIDLALNWAIRQEVRPNREELLNIAIYFRDGLMKDFCEKVDTWKLKN